MKKPDIWGTWDGRWFDFNKLSHEHLSNIHYFMNLISPKIYEKDFRDLVREILLTKYGKILPYRPDPKFKGEIDYLRRLGYLKPNGDIIVNGLKIGWYEKNIILRH